MNTRNCILVGLLLVFGGLLSYSQTTQGKAYIKSLGLVVQLDRISDFGSEGLRFESSRKSK